jgi:hypothetical protein
MNKQITRVWSFASDSNPNIEYETLQYADGTTSCNCKGWTRRVAPDGSRSCKHSRYVDMGTADARTEVAPARLATPRKVVPTRNSRLFICMRDI